MTVVGLWHHLHIINNTILTHFERYCKFCVKKTVSDDSVQENPTSPQTKSGGFFC